MPFTLRLVPQLDGSAHAGANCGPISTRHALTWSTRGELTPTPSAIRARIGKPSGPGDATSLSDQIRAWDKYREDARPDLRIPRYERQVAQPWEGVIDALDEGHGVVVQFDHATWNRIAPSLSGDPGFDGLHVTFLAKVRRRGNRVELLDYDGLFDGRRTPSGKRAPRGPQWVPAQKLKRVAEERVAIGLAKDMPETEAEEKAKGLATYGVIRRATKVTKPQPAPSPECGDAIADALNRFAEAHAERVAELENVLGEARTALEGFALAGEVIDAAIASIDELLPPNEDAPAPIEAGVGQEDE